MPCPDVSEAIHIVIDDQDRLKSYRFTKRVCGQAVGSESLLVGRLKGCTVSELLDRDPETFLAQNTFSGEVGEFLGLKHFLALQAAVRVLTGHQPGGPNDPCAAATITHDSGKTAIDARIAVDLLTEKITACCAHKTGELANDGGIPA